MSFSFEESFLPETKSDSEIRKRSLEEGNVQSKENSSGTFEHSSEVSCNKTTIISGVDNVLSFVCHSLRELITNPTRECCNGVRQRSSHNLQSSHQGTQSCFPFLCSHSDEVAADVNNPKKKRRVTAHALEKASCGSQTTTTHRGNATNSNQASDRENFCRVLHKLRTVIFTRTIPTEKKVQCDLREVLNPVSCVKLNNRSVKKEMIIPKLRPLKDSMGVDVDSRFEYTPL